MSILFRLVVRVCCGSKNVLSDHIDIKCVYAIRAVTLDSDGKANHYRQGGLDFSSELPVEAMSSRGCVHMKIS